MRLYLYTDLLDHDRQQRFNNNFNKLIISNK